MDAVTTFAARSEFESALRIVERLGTAHTVVVPDPSYALVGCPALVLSPEARAEYLEGGGGAIVSAGWAEYRLSAQTVPDEPPVAAPDDLIACMVIVVLAPCVADPEKLRLIAHLKGDAGEALPYMNAELQQASFTAKLPVLTFMEGHRMISLFRDRVAIAKADDIIDAWASLERLRCTVNEVWSRRDEIEPSFEARRRPPALEIYKRLPGTNCRECGEASCTAFAWSVWRGDADPRDCRPVFGGDRGDLRDALLTVCAGLGVPPEHDT